MKTVIAFAGLVLVAVLMSGCSGPIDLIEAAQEAHSGRIVQPSDVMVGQVREVSGLTGIDMRTVGKVIVTQGDSESLTVSGSENMVPLVKTSVRDGVLVIEMQEHTDLVNVDGGDVLTFDITVRDLATLTVSGLGEVDVESLSTAELAVTMSGAGQIRIGKLSAERVEILVSGLGNVQAAGKAAEARVVISGAGHVEAGDLVCESAGVEIPGLGTATVWATDSLSGSISGGGTVRYYGKPETSTESGAMGSFEALGSK